MLKHLPLLLAASLLGCGSQVLGGGGTTSGDPGTTTGDPGTTSGDPGGSGGSDPGGGTTAVAVTRAQNDALWDAYWEAHGGDAGSSSSGGDDQLDPNDLFLRASDLGETCSSPTVELSCGGHWELTVVLPPAFQAVGMYDLEDPALVMYSSLTQTDVTESPDPEECAWGGGSIGAGTLEVLAIDDSAVRFRVILADPFWNVDPSGEYTALRCP